MVDLTVKVSIDSEEVKPLVALCLEQVKLINDLNGAVFGRPDFYNRVAEMFDKINSMKLDDLLRDIQREAFEAGFNSHEYSEKNSVSVEDCFDQWMERDK